MWHPDEVFAILTTVLFVAAVGYLLSLARTFAYLRKHHVEVWTDLGCPSLFWNNSLRTNWLFLKFFLGRQYRAIGDRRVDVLFLPLWVCFVVAMTAMIGLSVLSRSQ